MVLQVVAGGHHTIFVTANGPVYARGRSSSGQLDVGGTETRLMPTLVTRQLQGKTAVYVATDESHTLLITSDGSLLSWGINLDGQIGVGERENRHVSTLVTRLQGKRVMHATASECHTICSTTDGSVFTWGGAARNWVLRGHCQAGPSGFLSGSTLCSRTRGVLQAEGREGGLGHVVGATETRAGGLEVAGGTSRTGSSDGQSIGTGVSGAVA